MYYILFYDVVDNYVEARQPYREEHLALGRAARERGELFMGGAFAEPADGAMLVFAVDDPAIVRKFAEEDPYVKNGVVTKWRVRPWTVVLGSEAPAKV
jgi:uncharacterized protein YciI